MWNMMSVICVIDCAPLVLGKGGSNYYIALSGYANDNRTFGAFKNNALWLKHGTKGAKSLSLCNAQGYNELKQLSTNGAK